MGTGIDSAASQGRGEGMSSTHLLKKTSKIYKMELISSSPIPCSFFPFSLKKRIPTNDCKIQFDQLLKGTNQGCNAGWNAQPGKKQAHEETVKIRWKQQYSGGKIQLGPYQKK